LVRQDVARATVLSLDQTTGAQGEVVSSGVFEIDAVIVPSQLFNDLDLHRKISGTFSTGLACDSKHWALPHLGDSVLLTISDEELFSVECPGLTEMCVPNTCDSNGSVVQFCGISCSSKCEPNRITDTISVSARVQPFGDALALGQGQKLSFSQVATFTENRPCQPSFNSAITFQCAELGQL